MHAYGWELCKHKGNGNPLLQAKLEVAEVLRKAICRRKAAKTQVPITSRQVAPDTQDSKILNPPNSNNNKKKTPAQGLRDEDRASELFADASRSEALSFTFEL